MTVPDLFGGLVDIEINDIESVHAVARCLRTIGGGVDVKIMLEGVPKLIARL